MEIPIFQNTPRAKHQVGRGPQRLNSENLEFNLSTLKKMLPDPNLVVENFTIGSRTQTKVSIVYLKDIVHQGILQEVKTRLEKIHAEIILDSNFIEKNIQNFTWSPFPQVEKTNRPDVTIFALNQGRIAILVNGTPDTLLAPTTLFDILDTYDDSYHRWFVASSFFRIARIILLLIATFLPAFHISLTSYNPELIPTILSFNIIAARSSSPLPVYLETFILIGIAEATRMVMLRFPTFIGQTVALFAPISLVLTGLASNMFGAPLIIIVTLSIIATYTISDFDLRSSVRMIQFFTMLFSTFFGLFGLAMAFFYINIHLVTLKSFGVPYLAPLAPMNLSAWGHTILKEDTTDMPPDTTYKRKLGDNNE
ncbi:MAG: spore germination protein [Peptococcales bacterium]|jgi:hypothetical protein